MKARVLLALAAFVLSIAAVEGALRFHEARLNRDVLPDAIEQTAPLAPGEVGTRVHVLALHDNPEISYGLRPGFEGLVQMGGVPTALVINRDGQRSPELPHAKPAGTLRILGLGDSVMFGHGMALEDTYLFQLQRLLEQAHPERRWEVINTAVFGYNAAQEVAVLRTSGLDFEPDLVLQGFVANDLNPIVYRNRAVDVWSYERSFFLDWLRERWSAPPHHDSTGTDASPPADHREDTARFERAMRELSLLRRREGFELLCFTHRSTSASSWMLAQAARRGTTTADLGRRVDAYLADAGVANYLESDLALSPHDGHPSVKHHRLIAQDLLATLEDTGILGRLLARTP